MHPKKIHYEGLPFNFGGLPDSLCNYDNTFFTVLPIPYDATTSYRSGTRLGPRAIIEASQNMELFDEQFHIDVSDRGICTLDPMILSKSDPARMVEQIRSLTETILADDKFVLALGGEHSISIGTIAAYYRKFPKLNVLQIDAHLDLRDSYEETPYNHACVMRRVIERCPRVAVGIRSFSQEEHEFLKTTELETFFMSDIRNNVSWIRDVCNSLSSPVYITIDLDGFDPSVCPGVGTPEPGGLSWFQVIDLLKKIADHHQIVGADIVELIPDTNNVVSEFAAARLAYKIMCLTTMQ